MNIMIGCPTGRGQIDKETVSSIFNIQTWIKNQTPDAKIEFAAVSHAEIYLSRNLIATLFLKSQSDILIGIDDDVGVKYNAFNAMLSADVDYIGACIPQRELSLKSFAEGIRRGLTDEQALRAAAPLVDGPNTQPGVSEVDRIGTGFFILRRNALMKLVEEGHAPKNTSLPGTNFQTLAVYNHINKKDGSSMSEDYSFCHRLKEAGISVHGYKGPGISHTGSMTFRS